MKPRIPAARGRAKRLAASAVIGIVTVVAVGAVLSGCGSSEPEPSPSPSPSSGVAALRAYLSDVDATLTRVKDTAGTLPDAVQGMSTVPDETWTAAAADLTDISQQLGDEAASLDALEAPSVLQSLQDAVVKGIESAKTAVDKLATEIESGAESAATKRAQVQSVIDEAQAQLMDFSDQLSDALGGVLASPEASPAP